MTGGYWIYPGDYFIMYLNVESVCCKTEPNIILYPLYVNKF